MLASLALGCSGTYLEGSAPGAARGPWGAGSAEGPVRYLDWYVGVGYSFNQWQDYLVEEFVQLPAYEIVLVYHLGYSWDIEMANWGGRFVHPAWPSWKIQSLVHTLGLRYTRPAGFGWWHLALGAGWCNNDTPDAEDTLGFRAAAGYTYPIFRPLNVGLTASYIWNETHYVTAGDGAPVSLSVLSLTASLAVTF